MKILVFSPHLPVPEESDDSVRAVRIVRMLAQAHEVHALCFLEDGISPEDLRREYGDYPESLIIVSETDSYQIQQSLDDTIQRIQPGIILFESSRLQDLSFPRHIPRIADVLHIEHLCLTKSILALEMLFGKTLGAIEYERLKRSERKTLESCNACIARSEADADYLRSFMPSANVILARDGVDISIYAPEKTEAEVPLVAASVDRYDPNSIDSIITFAADIWPKVLEAEPQAQLRVIGHNISSALKDAVKPGVVVDESGGGEREVLQSCWVYAAPTIEGGGPDEKILRAMSTARPIVTTLYGSRGVVLMDGESALIRTEEEQIASAIIDLLRNNALRRKLGSAARDYAVRLYDWSITLEPILDCINQIAAR